MYKKVLTDLRKSIHIKNSFVLKIFFNISQSSFKFYPILYSPYDFQSNKMKKLKHRI